MTILTPLIVCSPTAYLHGCVIVDTNSTHSIISYTFLKKLLDAGCAITKFHDREICFYAGRAVNDVLNISFRTFTLEKVAVVHHFSFMPSDCIKVCLRDASILHKNSVSRVTSYKFCFH